MNMYFNCKVDLNITLEDGSIKKRTDEFLINAVTYTEAESRLAKIVEQLSAYGCTVKSITKSNITTIMRNEENVAKFYKCKVKMFIPIEETGKFKETSDYTLVEAPNITGAIESALDGINSHVIYDCELESVTLTKISQVID